MHSYLLLFSSHLADPPLASKAPGLGPNVGSQSSDAFTSKTQPAPHQFRDKRSLDSFRTDTTFFNSVQMILLLLKGHPGSGKSTLANHLAHKLHIPVIDKDDARDCLQDFAMQIDTNRLNMASYDIMFRVLTRQLKCGLGGIVDCPLARPEVFAAAQDLGRQVCVLCGFGCLCVS